MQLRITTCLSVLAVASGWLPAAFAQNSPPRLPLPQAPAAPPAAPTAPSGRRRQPAAIPPGRPGKLYRGLAHQADGGGISPGILGIRHQPDLAGPGYPAHAGAGCQPGPGSGQGQQAADPKIRPRSSLSLPCPMANFWSRIRCFPSAPSRFRPIGRFCRQEPTGHRRAGPPKLWRL